MPFTECGEKLAFDFSDMLDVSIDDGRSIFSDVLLIGSINQNSFDNCQEISIKIKIDTK